jgi:hypothetical protein
MTYFLFGVIAFEGSHSGGGETPVSVQLVIEQVAEIIFKKKLPCPAVPRRGPDAGVHRIQAIFFDSGMNVTDSCPFLQSRIFLQ